MAPRNSTSAVAHVRWTTCCAILMASLVWLPAYAGGTGAPTEQSAENGTIWWSEIVTSDPGKSREFYSQVFGWTSKVVSALDTSRPPLAGEEEYTIYYKGGAEIAGAATATTAATDGARPGWVNYIQVGNVDAAAADVAKLGGKVVKAPYTMASVGRFALVSDPDGVLIGLVSPAKP